MYILCKRKCILGKLIVGMDIFRIIWKKQTTLRFFIIARILEFGWQRTVLLVIGLKSMRWWMPLHLLYLVPKSNLDQSRIRQHWVWAKIFRILAPKSDLFVIVLNSIAIMTSNLDFSRILDPDPLTEYILFKNSQNHNKSLSNYSTWSW